MKVIGFTTQHDSAAPAGEQIVRLAKLECGHLQRVDRGRAPTELRCLDGCARTFADLDVGDRFLFAHDQKNGYSELPETVIVHREKTGDRTYDVEYADGSIDRGLVGVGDNPVRKVTP